jgi:branched-chain amino acid transport system permease protein
VPGHRGETIHVLAQQLVNGLTLGAVYTLIALSFSLVMGILGVLNLAITELFMLGGYFGFTVIMAHLPLPLALAAGMAGAAIVAIVIEKLGYQPFRTAPVVTPMLSTLGFSIILQNVVTNVWGSDPLQLTDEVLTQRYTLGGVSVSAMQLTVMGATIVLVAALAFVVQRTSMGRALRAVAENRDVARLLGVSASRVTLIAFMLSGALAGAAGVMIGLHYAAITPYIGVEIGLKAIAVMVIGGTTRIWGALIAGPLIGVLEVMTVAYGGSQVRDFVVYGFMILVLLLRPQGLLGGSRSDQGQRV